MWLMPQVAQPCLRNTNALPEIHPNVCPEYSNPNFEQVIAKLSATNVYYIVLRLFLFVALENMKTNSLYDQGTYYCFGYLLTLNRCPHKERALP